jgi:hypothetical protein
MLVFLKSTRTRCFPSKTLWVLTKIKFDTLVCRWFSESGKLVQRLFNYITTLVEDEDTFVIVLIGMW